MTSGDGHIDDTIEVGALEAGTDDFGPNQWMVEQMFRRYQDAPASVSAAWQEFFAGHDPSPDLSDNGGAPPVAIEARLVEESPPAPPVERSDPPPPAPPVERSDSPQPAPPVERSDPPQSAPPPPTASVAPEHAHKMSGVTARIAEAMDSSLEVPTATSVRTIPAKLLEVNRRILNNQLRRRTGGGKVSFTHLIGWAVVRALREMPELNVSFEEIDGVPNRILHPAVNMGLAVDMEGRGGERVLIVPNLKDTEQMDFEAYWQSYEALIRRVRSNQITPEDFAGTTVSLTNPGMIGTVQSVPRLMKGQGLIVGVGAIIYPPEYQAADVGTLARLGIGRVITMTSTYDHRVIQGAQSGRFLGLIHRYLLGEEDFYDDIFRSTRVPYTPARWAGDDNPPFGTPAWAEKQARVFSLINAYRVRGHLIADLDPLRQETPSMPAELDPLTYGLTIWDLEREFATNGVGGETVLELGTLLGRLRDAYCRTIGIEYMHIQHEEEKRWIQRRLEVKAEPFAAEEKVEILERLNRAESFETFLHTKYVGHKRFGLEGVESLIPLMGSVLDDAAAEGVEEAVIGMAHRGRLNVLANIVGKSRARMFREFAGDIDPNSIQGSGDVKYHLGSIGQHRSRAGDQIQVEVVANPSHLEAVDPVLEGVVRAKQEMIGKLGYTKILPILLHGDAAFAGQGVVVETLNLSQLLGYRTGGTIHIIVNNQVGFTTSTVDARSSHYATDVAKTVQAPIIHVNADDPEAVVRAARFAFAYRQEFAKDVVLDMIGYRRRGHNEGDEPSFTQPVMYRRIDARPTVRRLYLDRLVSLGELSEEDGDRLLEDFRGLLQEAFEHTEEDPPTSPDASPADNDSPVTGVGSGLLAELNQYVTTPPAGFTVHPKLVRVLDGRTTLFAQGLADWAMAEYFAVGSLAEDGTWVRIAGEDLKRGTFSHRHAALVDFETGEQWIALQERTFETTRVRFVDSHLSEFAAVGFEYGYSVEHQNSLVAWEAQFGDFANGAQVIIDQFVFAGETKWEQRSGLVLLLPHGYEGQGPEHSSARIERYLQMAAERNVRILVPSTPAQLFHMFRRQTMAEPKRPAIVFSPKSLLRTKASYSLLSEFTGGRFKPVVPDPRVSDPGQVSTLAFCSGKVFYAADIERETRQDTSVALVRVEQLYPFPGDEIRDELDRYPNADLVWLQEEPENMGACVYVMPRIRDLTGRSVTIAARPRSASTATGNQTAHALENEALMNALFES